MRYLIRYILLVFLLYSCETMVDIPDIKNDKSIIVIEATLSDKLENQLVRVTWSTGLKDSISCILVDNAKVSMMSSVGDTLIYSYIDNGWYKCPQFQAKKGIIYKLGVNVDSTCYTSTGEITGDRFLDTVYYKYLENYLDQDEGYYAFFNIDKKVSDSINYYLMDVWKNNKQLTNGSNFLLFIDQYQYQIHDLKIPFTFSLNDTVDIEVISISKQMFDYYLFIYNKLFSIDISSIGYISNPPVLFTPEAMGYFQVYQSTKKTIIIK